MSNSPSLVIVAEQKATKIYEDLKEDYKGQYIKKIALVHKYKLALNMSAYIFYIMGIKYGCEINKSDILIK